MANTLHVEKLAEGPRAWNAWRAENPGVVADLSGLELSAGRSQFGPAQGGPIDLGGVDLRGAALGQATLIGANLAGASLAGADLSRARLENADLRGADLSQAKLDQADLRNARLDDATVSGAQLRHARSLTQAQLDLAIGDATTELPPGLAMPDRWLGGGSAASSRLARRAGDKVGKSNGASRDPYSVL